MIPLLTAVRPLREPFSDTLVVANQVDAETTDEALITVDHANEEHVYQVSTSPFITGDVVTGRLVTFVDVTEREQYRDELEIQTDA